MAATSLLARLGLRVATLGSAASLAIAAPIAEGDVSQDAHTHAARTGWFFPDGNKIGVVANGIDAARFWEDGSVQIGGTYTAGYGTAGGLRAVKMSINRGPFQIGGTIPSFQQNGTAIQDRSMGLASWNNGTVFLIFGVANGSGTIGVHAVATPANTNVAALSWNASDGTVFRDIARIDGTTEATTAAGSSPGYLRFYTTSVGSVAVTEKMRLFSDGGLQLGGVFAVSPGAGRLLLTDVVATGTIGFNSKVLSFTTIPNAYRLGSATTDNVRANTIGIGNITTMSGIESVQIGNGTTGFDNASTNGGVLIGHLASASGNASIIIGGNASGGGSSIVVGRSASAAGGSIAIGQNAVATVGQVVFGQTTAINTVKFGDGAHLVTFLNPLSVSGLVQLDAANNRAITQVAVNTALDVTHYTILVDASAGAVVITLPDSTVTSNINGRIYNVKKIDASVNTVTVQRTGASDLIDGAPTDVLTTQYQSRSYQCRTASAAANRWNTI